MLSAVYAQAARSRRALYGRPGRRRHLHRPVVSVGNLSVGGTGKTPAVAHVVRVLQAMGERPSVLTRGYRRRRPAEGVVVVHDGTAVRADLDASGDEPLMLARALDGVPVLVGADRYLAGRLAELHLAATVHVLDDGFQHLPLHRDADLLIVSRQELDDPRTLPAGRLRESLRTAALADAVLVDADDDGETAEIADRIGVAERFRLRRHLHAPLRLDERGEGVPLEPGGRVFAVAGIARPARFYRDLEALGLDVAGTLTFPDHHPYSAHDVSAISDGVRRHGATAMITTEKDLVRLTACGPLPVAVAWVPLTVAIEPAGHFRTWLAARLAAARGGGA